MPNSWFARISACLLFCLCTAAFAQPATTSSHTRPAVAVSAIQGEPSSDQPNALQPRTLNELFQAARDDGHVNVIVTLDLGTTFQSEGQLSTAAVDQQRDRKSTRLNSSHVAISYAVFCLKKKKKKE